MTGFGSIEFGFAGAQTERARAPELLLEGFLDEGHVMEEALAGWRFLFLGYKGCGKTAIVERARLLARGDPALHVSAATLQEFSYEDFRTFAGGSGDFQSRYPPAWAWNLLLLLIESFEADEGARAAADPYYAKVVSSLEALDLMPVPKLNQLVQRTSKQQFKVGIPKFLELMGERGSESQDLQLAQMVRVLRKATLRFRSQSRHVVFLDGLDDVLTAQELQFQAISALITEAARLNDELHEEGVPAKFVVLCRTDIFDRLPGANLSKIRQDSALALNLPEKIERRPTVRYLFDHTRHTPRDELHGYLERSEIDSVLTRLLTSIGGRRRASRSWLRLATVKRSVRRLLKSEIALFECGVVGMFDEGPGGARRYTFKFRNRHAIPILSNTFVLHRGAHRAFGIDRAR